ncbi:DUF5681 domain-containing protein [Mesorhizobium sp. ZMM04-5]|uniref:DUF5681 domain-containing protein n=1 Tax=Mesorhizobium marinum TaxID=3228790 RepID=A0ABV3QXB6_9HYPH
MTQLNEPPKDTRWKPGQSGNPNGRPAGSRSKVCVALDALAEGEAEEIVLSMIEKAKQGDSQAGRTLLERIWPARKGARIAFRLPEVSKAAELPGAIADVNRQVAEGDLSPEEGAVIVGLLDAQRRAIETNDLAERIAAIEEKMAAGKRR